MIELVSQPFAPIPGPRCPERMDSSLHDTLMRGLALMFFRIPTCLRFSAQCSNAAISAT
jgi:hypothetical protein